VTGALDRRLNAFRDDRADIRLRPMLTDREFVSGRPAVIAAPVVDFRDAPAAESECVSQGLYGETVSVFEDRDGWSWVQADLDDYVGYVQSSTLEAVHVQPTHMVAAQRSYRYTGPDLRFPVVDTLSIGSRLKVAGQAETRGTRYAVLEDGTAVVAGHLRPVGESEADYVDAAMRFLHSPYLWGGRSGFGVDCSGLIQLSMMMAGRSILRDTDMQAESVGTLLAKGPGIPDLMRGDLVFWKGHVAIMTDRDTMLHASGHSLTVTLEPIGAAVDRIAASYGWPTAFRRP
jgi:cell wall-associated NlpC family hydrolase